MVNCAITRSLTNSSRPHVMTIESTSPNTVDLGFGSKVVTLGALGKINAPVSELTPNIRRLEELGAVKVYESSYHNTTSAFYSSTNNQHVMTDGGTMLYDFYWPSGTAPKNGWPLVVLCNGSLNWRGGNRPVNRFDGSGARPGGFWWETGTQIDNPDINLFDPYAWTLPGQKGLTPYLMPRGYAVLAYDSRGCHPFGCSALGNPATSKFPGISGTVSGNMADFAANRLLNVSAYIGGDDLLTVRTYLDVFELINMCSSVSPTPDGPDEGGGGVPVKINLNRVGVTGTSLGGCTAHTVGIWAGQESPKEAICSAMFHYWAEGADANASTSGIWYGLTPADSWTAGSTDSSDYSSITYPSIRACAPQAGYADVPQIMSDGNPYNIGLQAGISRLTTVAQTIPNLKTSGLEFVSGVDGRGFADMVYRLNGFYETGRWDGSSMVASGMWYKNLTPTLFESSTDDNRYNGINYIAQGIRWGNPDVPQHIMWWQSNHNSPDSWQSVIGKCMAVGLFFNYWLWDDANGFGSLPENIMLSRAWDVTGYTIAEPSASYPVKTITNKELDSLIKYKTYYLGGVETQAAAWNTGTAYSTSAAAVSGAFLPTVDLSYSAIIDIPQIAGLWQANPCNLYKDVWMYQNGMNVSSSYTQSGIGYVSEDAEEENIWIVGAPSANISMKSDVDPSAIVGWNIGMSAMDQPFSWPWSAEFTSWENGWYKNPWMLCFGSHMFRNDSGSFFEEVGTSEGRYIFQKVTAGNKLAFQITNNTFKQESWSRVAGRENREFGPDTICGSNWSAYIFNGQTSITIPYITEADYNTIPTNDDFWFANAAPPWKPDLPNPDDTFTP